jgi:hypothetical protein
MPSLSQTLVRLPRSCRVAFRASPGAVATVVSGIRRGFVFLADLRKNSALCVSFIGPFPRSPRDGECPTPMPHGRVSGNVVLRASVGSTEASDGRLARVGLIDRRIGEPPCARRCRRTDAQWPRSANARESKPSRVPFPSPFGLKERRITCRVNNGGATLVADWMESW